MKVKIKTWRALEKEFGLDENGDIDCKFAFVPEMEEKMPKDRIIEVKPSIDPIEGMFYLFKADDSDWWISDDMIEQIIEE